MQQACDQRLIRQTFRERPLLDRLQIFTREPDVQPAILAERRFCVASVASSFPLATADGLPFTTNIGDGANAGLEVEAAWRLNSDLDLRAAALINDPQITRRSPNFNARLDAGLPGVSRASAGLVVDYHRQLGGDYTFRFLAQSAYVGSSYLTFDASDIQAMGNYVSLRTSVSIETAAWSLSASLDNPFNAASNTFSFGNPFLIGREQVVTPLRPRTVAVRLTGRF